MAGKPRSVDKVNGGGSVLAAVKSAAAKRVHPGVRYLDSLDPVTRGELCEVIRGLVDETLGVGSTLATRAMNDAGFPIQYDRVRQLVNLCKSSPEVFE